MMNILRFQLTCFLFVLSVSTLLSQQRIVGSSVIEEDCCEIYTFSTNDSIGYWGIWILEDATGNILDTLSQTGPRYSFEICLEKYKNYTPPLLLTMRIDQPQGQIIVEKVIEVIPSYPLEIYSEYPCIVRDSGCTEICFGTVATYNVESNNPNGIDWEVQGGTILINDGWSITVEWNEVGTHYVRAIDISSSCPKENELCVVVLPVPTSEIQSSPSVNSNNEITICKGQTIYFDDLSTDALNIRWSFGNGISSIERNTEVTYTDPGQYEVVLIADNGCACKDTTALKVTVLDAKSPELTCVGTTCPSETNTYYVINDCPQTVWTVSGNGVIVDGGSLTDDFITVEWNYGPYGIITVLGQNCPAGYCPEPSVYRIPVISGDGPVEGDTEVCYNQIETYTAPFFQGTQYYWTVSSGASIIGLSNQNTLTVQWDRVNAPNRQQWVEVVYDNCYLECGGQDKLDIAVLGRIVLEGPNSICFDENATFNTISLGANTPVSAEWEIKDSLNQIVFTGSGSVTSLTEAFPFPGIFTVSATITSPDYCDNYVEKKIRVQPLPPKPHGIVTETEVCKNALHEFAILNPDPKYISVWSIDDGGNISNYENQTSIQYQFKSDGPYSVELYYKQAGGLECASEIVVTSLGKYQYVINGDQNVCHENIGEYKCQSVRPSGFKWSISPDDAGVIIAGQGENEVEIFWSKPGSHNVNLEHCGGMESIAVDIHDRPQPSVIHDDKVCEGSTTLVTLDQAYSQVVWKDENDVTVGTNSDIQLGAGHYSVEVSNAQGCIQEVLFTINSRPAPDAVISFGDIRAFCDTEPFTPRILYANTDGTYNYEWFWNGAPAGSNSPTLKATFFGTYHCIVTNALGCSKRSNNLVLLKECDNNEGRVCNGKCNKKTCPDATVDFDILDEGAYCNQKKLVPNVSGTIISNWWYIEDLRNNGWDESTQLEPIHTFSSAGYHMIILDALVRPFSNPGITCYDHTVHVVKIPLAAWFTADNQCVNTPVSFEDLTTYIPGETISSYSWDFGDPTSGANTSSDENPSHMYSSPGKYMVKLVVEAASGCISEYEKEIEIYNNPSLDFSLPTQICVGAPLEVSANLTIKDVKWDFGTPAHPNNIAGTHEAYFEYDAIGMYTITLSGKNQYGCNANVSKTIQVIDVSMKESITTTGTLPLCQGASIVLEGPKNAASWYWSNGMNTQDITVSSPGKYSVEVVTVDGCRYTTNEFEVIVNPLPSIFIVGLNKDENNEVISRSSLTLDICAGDKAGLEAIAKTGLQITWSNARSGYTQDIPTWTSTGTYQYSADAQDPATGCTSASNMIAVNIHPLPNVPNIVASQTGLLCENEPVTFTISNYDNTLSYIWSNGQTGQSITTSSSGVYFVSAINAFGCSSSSNALTIYPAPNADVVISGCLTRCDPDTICLPDIPGAQLYQWYKDGVALPAPEGTIKDFVATESGIYRLKVTNAAGCSDISDPLELIVTPGYGDLTITVYFDSNENGIIDAGDIIVPNIKVNITPPSGSVFQEETNLSGQIIKYNQESGIYYTEVINDSLIVVPGMDQVEIFGCGDPFNIEILLSKKCPEYTLDIDTTICALDTLFILDTMLTASGPHTLEIINSDGCLETTNINLTHGPASNDLTIRVYIDKNNNGIIDAGDVSFPFAQLEVFKNGIGFTQTQSDGDGILNLPGLDIGQYEVYIDSTSLGPEYQIIQGYDSIHLNTCTGEFELRILLKVIDTNVFIPNVFSPNGDQSNDIFRVFTGNENDLITYFAIYNRWGELLFESNETSAPSNIGWNGMFKGNLLNPGVFVYVIGVESFTGDWSQYTGDVTLMR